MTLGTSCAAEIDSVIDTLQTMRGQEENSYRIPDYLQQRVPQQSYECQSDLLDDVNAECRSRMADWCYQISDFCDYKRETVAVAISCLDRFLCTPAGCEIRKDRNLFQLATMSVLYTSIKIHEFEAMNPNTVASLSRGLFSRKEVLDMELKILTSLQWRVNPPTALAFLDIFLRLIPNEIVSYETKEQCIEMAKFQTEIAVTDPHFISVDASSMALASLLNSLERLNFDCDAIFRIQCVLSDLSRIDSRSYGFHRIRGRLFGVMTGKSSMYSDLVPRPTKSRDTCAVKPSDVQKPIHLPVSPRSVSVSM